MRRPPSVAELAAALVAVLLGTLALPIEQSARSGYQSLKTLTDRWPPVADRELGLGLGGDLNGALLAAQRVIPRDAVICVRVGEEPPIDSVYLDGAPGIFRYWLLPRRYTEVAHSADWIITSRS